MQLDWNGSAAQLMPIDDLPSKWRAFGWNVHLVDGHSIDEIEKVFSNITFKSEGNPNVICKNN